VVVPAQAILYAHGVQVVPNHIGIIDVVKFGDLYRPVKVVLVKSKAVDQIQTDSHHNRKNGAADIKRNIAGGYDSAGIRLSARIRCP
jgi:hypothetical protein